MESIVVERTLDQPIGEAALHSLPEQFDWCLKQHRVIPLYSYLRFGGRHVVCLYHSPDAEAVRRVNHQVPLPAQSTWLTSIHTPPTQPPPEAGGLVLVERSFPEAESFERLQAIEDGGAACLEQHRVRFARTYFSRDHRRMLCVYRAPDAESVRLAQKKIGMPFDDVWAATLVVHTTAPD